MNIYLALLLSVAAFACGWGISTLRQKSIIREQVQAQARVQAIAVPFRYALNITEAAQDYMEWGVKHSNATTESPKLNSLPRYEPS